MRFITSQGGLKASINNDNYTDVKNSCFYMRIKTYLHSSHMRVNAWKSKIYFVQVKSSVEVIFFLQENVKHSILIANKTAFQETS